MLSMQLKSQPTSVLLRTALPAPSKRLPLGKNYHFHFHLNYRQAQRYCAPPPLQVGLSLVCGLTIDSAVFARNLTLSVVSRSRRHFSFQFWHLLEFFESSWEIRCRLCTLSGAIGESECNTAHLRCSKSWRLSKVTFPNRASHLSRFLRQFAASD